jgi:hypothetical protein
MDALQLGEQLTEECAVNGLALVEMTVPAKSWLHVEVTFRVGARMSCNHLHHSIKAVDMSGERGENLAVISTTWDFALKPVASQAAPNLVVVEALPKGAERRNGSCRGKSRWLANLS